MGCLCDCDSLGDVNLDGGRNPLDVVLMVNFVYKGLLPPFPDLPDCPAMNGDWNCDNLINPVDVVRIVNYVYKSSGIAPCDPCGQLAEGNRIPSHK